METKSLLSGVGGLLLGGLIVAIAAATLNKPTTDMSQPSHSTVDSLQDKTGDEYDKSFLSHMIVHHEGAIDTAKLSAMQAKHAEIKKLSEDMITAQQKEIDQMKQWQIEWGYSPGHSEKHTH